MILLGTCICEEGYDSDDCYLKKSDAPSILSIEGNGMCDVSGSDTCNCIEITTNGSSNNAVCVFVIGLVRIGHNHGLCLLRQHLGPCTPTILQKVHSLQRFSIFLNNIAVFECSTTSGCLNHMV